MRDRMNDVVSQLAAAGALIVVFIALSIASPYFLTSNNLFNVVVQIASPWSSASSSGSSSGPRAAWSTGCSSRAWGCRRSSPRWA
jgi:Asp-tRNA(Asn)/Glu-tRNA(Gln) amidotransferase A subunit family amidase